jgi:hypothetical protein
MLEEERRKSIAWLYYIDITVNARVYLRFSLNVR